MLKFESEQVELQDAKERDELYRTRTKTVNPEAKLSLSTKADLQLSFEDEAHCT